MANVTEITEATYRRKQKHGYAGPLSELGTEVAEMFTLAGATVWCLMLTNQGTALVPAKIVKD